MPRKQTHSPSFSHYIPVVLPDWLIKHLQMLTAGDDHVSFWRRQYWMKREKTAYRRRVGSKRLLDYYGQERFISDRQ
jgi:hypothetical protein